TNLAGRFRVTDEQLQTRIEFFGEHGGLGECRMLARRRVDDHQNLFDIAHGGCRCWMSVLMSYWLSVGNTLVQSRFAATRPVSGQARNRSAAAATQPERPATLRRSTLPSADNSSIAPSNATVSTGLLRNRQL